MRDCACRRDASCVGIGPRVNQNRTASSLFALTLGAIGIVYGDIGTSPLYALKEVARHGHVPLTESNIYGVLLHSSSGR